MEATTSMFPKEMVFSFDYQKPNKYILWVQFDGGIRMVIDSWKTKPTKEDIEKSKAVTLRAIGAFHNHIRLPELSMEVKHR